MKYKAVVDQIRSGRMTRTELQILRARAHAKQRDGDQDAHLILQEVDSAVARDSGIIFMGFCPSADIANRLDAKWKSEGVCTFDFDESVKQTNIFRSICAGDLVVLKKNKPEEFGKAMSLHGHGRVRALKTGEDGRRYLEMTWTEQDQVLLAVPLMGCQATVNLRAMEKVEGEMPNEFFDWLGQPRVAQA